MLWLFVFARAPRRPEIVIRIGELTSWSWEPKRRTLRRDPVSPSDLSCSGPSTRYVEPACSNGVARMAPGQRSPIEHPNACTNLSLV
jgi:hypothetical protein